MSEVLQQNAAILARCSTEANVCNQILSLKQYAACKYIVTEDDIYGDNIGGSSGIEERPALQRLMQQVEAGKQYSVVLVQDESRLGKSPERVKEIIDWFGQRNIPVHFSRA